MVFMPNLLDYLLIFGPSFKTHGSFTILSFLIMSIFSFSFIEVMLFIYSFVTFSKTVIQCSFNCALVAVS